MTTEEKRIVLLTGRSSELGLVLQTIQVACGSVDFASYCQGSQIFHLQPVTIYRWHCWPLFALIGTVSENV